MNKIILFYFILLTSCFIATAQDAGNYSYDKNIKVQATRDPEYPAGENALYEYVYNKLEFSRDAVDRKLKGESMINFDVQTDSTLTNFSVVKEVGYGVDQSIINILKELKFSPGMINGKVAQKNLVLTFPIEVE